MEIDVKSTFQRVTFIIRDFFELPQEEEFLDSPEFLFHGDRFGIRLYPKDNRDETAFHVRRLSVNFPNNKVSCRIGLRRRKPNGDEDYDYYQLSLEENCSYSRSMIEEDRDEFVPDGSLTVVCRMRLTEEGRAGSSAQRKEQQGGFPDLEKLQSDYRQLLEKGTESDACLVVREKEFQVHKNVLRARSTIFEAMFDHDTAEKESGRVVVDDLDPDTFGDFLEYLYTGDIGSGLSDNNTFGLYVAAHYLLVNDASHCTL